MMPHMEFIQAVRAAVMDEMEAARFYSQLARTAPNEAFRARIRCFAADECRHAKFLGSLLPGGAPAPMGPDDLELAESQDGPPCVSWSPVPPHQPLPPGQPMPPQPPAPEPGVPGTFAEGVATAIEGETDAIEAYAELAALAPDLCVREQILCIQKDEMYHLVSFEFMQSIIGRP